MYSHLHNFILIFLFISLVFGCKKKHCTPESCTQSAIIDTSVNRISNQIIALISNVSLADAAQYSSKDDKANSMDCAKIIEYRNDTFISVYHTYKNDIPYVHLAISIDLLHWKQKVQLAVKASQPTIYLTASNKFIIAFEQEPNNHIKVLQYDNFNALILNQYSKYKDIEHNFSNNAEGTPNIYLANDSIVDIGYHYWCNGDVDRQARGELSNFSTWTTQKEPCIDNAILSFNLHGNIGDRDVINFQNIEFMIIEGQNVKDDFGTWKIYLYNSIENKAYPINIQTTLRSHSFANPTIQLINFNNKDAILITLFLHTVGANKVEERELIYYKFL